LSRGWRRGAKKAQKSGYLPKNSLFLAKKRAFFGVCRYRLINSKKDYLIENRRLTKNLDAKNGRNSIGGWGKTVDSER